MIYEKKIRVTAICDACKSMKHYQWRNVLNRREETAAMKEGTQLHMLVLEPEKFKSMYFTDQQIPDGMEVVKTVDDLKSFLGACGAKINPKWKKDDLLEVARNVVSDQQYSRVLIYDDWVEANTANREYISKEKWDKLHHMKDSVLSHSFTRKYLEMGIKEVPVEGELYGWHVTGRPDWVVDDPNLPYVIIIDLKKTVSAVWYRFRDVIEREYHFVQAALYEKLIQLKYGKPCLYVWMAVEGAEPYITEAHSANEAMMETGLVNARNALKKLEVSYENDYWPGYTDGQVHNIDLPNRQYDKAAEMELEEENEETTI